MRSRLSISNLGRPSSAWQIPPIHPLSAIWNRARTSGECMCERRIKERKVLVKKGQKKGFAPRVRSYGQSTALIPPETSPHKRRLKCVTNISPRRLMTHLLHQMVHYRATLRGSEQSSTTIVRITIHTNATILNIKIKSSESCAMWYLLRVTQSTGKAGCRTVPYSTSSGTKSGSSSVKI